MANRRNGLLVSGFILVVVLMIGVVIWRVQTNRGEDTAGPGPTTDSTSPGGTGPTAPTSDAPTTSTTFPASVAQPEPPFPTTRDAKQWPFAWHSIWNLPLGTNAQRVPAGMSLAENGVSVDEDILVLAPDAPKVDVIGHDGGWNPQVNRCSEVQGNVLFRGVPIPTDFVTDPGFLGATPNHAAAILLEDGDSIVQTQPLHRCLPGGPAVSQYAFDGDSLHNGTGIPGAHGGSRMSSLGGTLRLGELVPGGAIRHALKINIDCQAYCSFNQSESDGKPGFRWPATAADSGAAGRYRGEVDALQMGSLLALPADFNADALRTEPARMVARGFMRYGAYVVDDTRYPIFALTTEWSPDGRVIDEFEQEWGFPMQDAADADCDDDSAGCAWVQDFAQIVSALQVIDNNEASSIGGGGARLVPCAPTFTDGSGSAEACTTT